MIDRTKIVDFMKRFSFATLVTSQNNFPEATHLPFVIREENDQLVLYSHFARQNDQWKQIENSPVLVIFNEPHSYVSPAHYEKEMNVPTWNYLSVHAYGKAQLISSHEAIVKLLESTISTYEASYQEQWNRLPEKFKTGMMAGIVAFRVDVTDLQAKEKLSQNKTFHEQQNIMNALYASSETNDRIMAEYMQQNLPS